MICGHIFLDYCETVGSPFWEGIKKEVSFSSATELIFPLLPLLQTCLTVEQQSQAYIMEWAIAVTLLELPGPGVSWCQTGTTEALHLVN